MSCVFIGGSRRLSRINTELAQRLDNIIERGLCVLVGDANGFDRAAQSYLAQHNYHAVKVYCTAGKCRNNVGNWIRHDVEYSGRSRGREFYTAKDDVMLQDADFGLFAWDGISLGTWRNIRKMAEQGKPSVIYISSGKKSIIIRNACELTAFLDSSAGVHVAAPIAGSLF